MWTLGKTYDKSSDIKTNVSTLLREFPRVRRAALSGERVVIETQEGNLVLTAEAAENKPHYASMKTRIVSTADDLDAQTLPDDGWDSSF